MESKEYSFFFGNDLGMGFTVECLSHYNVIFNFNKFSVFILKGDRADKDNGHKLHLTLIIMNNLIGCVVSCFNVVKEDVLDGLGQILQYWDLLEIKGDEIFLVGRFFFLLADFGDRQQLILIFFVHELKEILALR